MTNKLKQEILEFSKNKEVIYFAVKSEYKELLDLIECSHKEIKDDIKNEYIIITR